MSLMTPNTIRKLSNPKMLTTAPFWLKPRIDSLFKILGPLAPNGSSTVNIPRLKWEWNRVVNANPSYVIKGPIIPFHIRSTYGDPDGQAEDLAKIDPDINTAVDLAYRWLFLNDAMAASKCVEIIKAYSKVNSWDLTGGATTTLVWSSRIPKLIQAIYMIENYPGLTHATENEFKNMVQKSIDIGASASINYTNNVGVWGIVFDIACAKLLDNRKMLDVAIAKWRSYFNESIVDNVPIHEVHREANTQGDGSYGLWYSNFTAYAYVVAAEWARYSGEWLYDYVSPNGSSLRGFVELVRYWTRHPELFPYNTSGTPSRTVRSLPHDEITHCLWPNADSQWIIDNFPTGSDRDSHGGRGYTLIYRNRPLYG